MPSPKRAALTIGVALLGTPVGAGHRAGDPAEAPIRLRVATFVPSRGEPAVRAGLAAASVPRGERGTYLVQLAGPVEPAWKAELEVLGAELLDYVPDFAFKARMSAEQASRARALPHVRWVGPFHPAYKLSPRLRTGGERLYTVRLERGVDASRGETAIRTTGARVVARQGRTVMLAATRSRLEALAALPDVAWIEDFVLRQKHNEYAGGVIMGAAVANGAGYDGSSQTIALADTGLGGGTAATAHADVPAGRIAGIVNWPGVPDICFETIMDDGAVDVDSGHGTHTAASALGSGDAAGKGRGTAPGARLYFQAVENYVHMSALCQYLGYDDGYYLAGLPADLRTLFLPAYAAGARVHSDSWGVPLASDYTADSANTDDFVWTHRDMVVTFSAGNEGTDADGDGGVDGWSLDAPATAKNVIAVGASESDRASDYECDAAVFGVCAFQGGQNLLPTYGQNWPFAFPAEPLKSDPTAGNPEQMAAFSSRGPAGDGRIKPDIVAPGTWVLSAFSDLYQEGYDPSANPQTGLYQYDGWGFPAGATHKYMGGTSMSAPLVAGGAAVVRDYYEKLHSHPASAALVKATLVNSAVDLLDENNDGVNDNALAIPNVYEGWGRVDLAAATDGSRLFVDEGEGLSTGGAQTFAWDVGAGTPLKVTLAWTDYPSTEAAGRNLVNDLDLEVSGPGGVLYRGNVFGRGWSATGGLHDTTNNLENVFVESPAAGTWTVTVRGYNVPQGPQSFALVVGGLVSMAATTRDLTVTPPVHGTVTSTDGFLACGTGGTACRHSYAEGALVELHAGADPGYALQSWTGDCTGLACSLTMDREHQVGATFAVLPVTASVADAEVSEGHCGVTNLWFAVTLDSASPAAVTVSYQTEDGTAVAGEDFAARTGVLTFDPGVLTLSVVVPVNGDTAFEPAETLTLRLTGATGAILADDAGVGTISNDDPDPLSGEEWAHWTNAVGVSSCGPDVTKTAPAGWGNAGASSTRALDGDGRVEFTVPAGPGYAFFGLTHRDADSGYADVDYGFYTYPPTGELMVFENGTYRGSFGAYAPGQKLAIVLESEAVSYWRDDVRLYASGRLPSLPLRVDLALYSTGARVHDVLLAGQVVDLAAAPTEPVFWTNAWGVGVAANTITKTAATGWGNAGASSTRGIGGEGRVEFTVPVATGYALFGLGEGDSDQGYADVDFAFYTYAATGQLMIFERGAYRGTFGDSVAGQKLQIVVDAGEVSYWRDGVRLFTSTAAPALPLRVDTSLYSTGAKVQDVLLEGTLVDLPASPTEPVVWTNAVGVAVSSNTITKAAPTGWGTGGAASTRAIGADGDARFTVSASPGYALFGLSHGDTDQNYPDVDFAFYTYAATTQLMVVENGVHKATVGTYSPGDQLRVGVGAGVVRYWHNGTLVYTSAQAPVLPLRVDTALYSNGAVVQGATLTGTIIEAAGLLPGEAVEWRDLVGVVASPTALTKTAATGWGNAGACSTRAIDGEGYAEFLVPVDPGYAMFGLAHGDTGQGYDDIDYAFYTYPPTGQLMIYESGVYKGDFGAYSESAILRVAVESGVVKYFRDGALVYTSAQPPTLPLGVDTALYSTGAVVQGATLAGALAP